MADFLNERESLVCSDNVPPLVTHDNISALTFFPEHLHIYGQNVTCSYVPLHRHDDFITAWEKGVKFLSNKSVPVKDEFIQVECLNNNEELVFEEFFSFIQQKTFVEKRSEKIRLKQPHFNEQLSVLILLISSVSRNHYLRQMKKTHDYLKQFTKVIDMKGFNMLTSNTFTSLIPLLTGSLVQDFNLNPNSTLDSLPFIWKEYAAKGYKVLFSEDAPSNGVLQSHTKGFIAQPTDYYYRPFTIAYQDKMLTYTSDLGCIKTQREAEVILKWVRHFFQMFSSQPVFAFTSLSSLSNNSMDTVYQYDDDVLNFFKYLKKNNHLNRSIVFFMSDHGFQQGKGFRTYIGRMEAKLPLLLILLPPWFSSKYPNLYSNIKTNSGRLTTVLDIHATLKDILKLPSFDELPKINDKSSVSLLRSVISQTRTCNDALIMERYCACRAEEPVPFYSTRVMEAAQKIVKLINKRTFKWRSKCSFYKLSFIVNATYEPFQGTKKYKISFNHRIIIKTEPGVGIFMGKVWFMNEAESYTADPAIQRINSLGQEADCLSEISIKPFCHCRYKYFLF